jgi:hypothetical protein
MLEAQYEEIWKREGQLQRERELHEHEKQILCEVKEVICPPHITIVVAHCVMPQMLSASLEVAEIEIFELREHNRALAMYIREVGCLDLTSCGHNVVNNLISSRRLHIQPHTIACRLSLKGTHYVARQM